MEFKKYQHVVRLGTTDCEGLLDGICTIMPKIDGTNGTIYLDDDGHIACGSRRKILNEISDNQGFYSRFSKDPRIIAYFKKHPNHRLYGEYLKPHSLKSYIDEAWDKFYVFDVCNDDGETIKYIPFDEYEPLLKEFDIDYIPVLATIGHPTQEQLLEVMQNNHYLIQEGMGIGEGIVIKRYDYVNRYGRVQWGKMINSEFTNRPKAKQRANQKTQNIEKEVCQRYLTDFVIEKEYQKIIHSDDYNIKKIVPRMINTLKHTLVEEDMWNIVCEYKNPTINFKDIQYEIVERLKDSKPDLFVRHEE